MIPRTRNEPGARRPERAEGLACLTHGNRVGKRGAAVVGLAVAGLIGTALPAFAHASFSSAPAFGFAPNPSGGTGVVGSTPPYVPGSTQNVVVTLTETEHAAS